MENKLKPCPFCGKQPKVIVDYGYEFSAYGSWVTIQCKRIFGKPHEKVQAGRSTRERALKAAVEYWNYKVETTEVKADEQGKIG